MMMKYFLVYGKSNKTERATLCADFKCVGRKNLFFLNSNLKIEFNIH